MTTFNHLNVPEGWKQYYTKYPEGYTILEALLNWVQQVNDMTDNVNQWNDYLESFVLTFDKDLQDTVRKQLQAWLDDGTLSNIVQSVIDQIGRISIKQYEYLKASNGDWSAAIQQAITDAKALGKEVFIPMGVYDIYATINVPEFVSISGMGEHDGGSVLNYKGAAGGWAMQTSGQHQRNRFKDFRIDMNGLGNALKIGVLGGSVIPILFEIDNVGITDIAPNYWGVEIDNASHMNVKRLNIGFGTLTGGNGLKVASDAGINTGVFHFNDCILGRVSATDISLQIDGAVDIDSINFDSCYIGGQRVKIGENTVIRSLNFESCHVEMKYLTGSTLTKLEAIQLYQVYGGGFHGGTVAMFNQSNTTAFAFKSNVKKFNIEGVEANGVMSSIYSQDVGTTLEGCILQEANITNAGTAVQFTNIDKNNHRFLAKRFAAPNIDVQYLYGIDEVNKIDVFGNQSPTLDAPANGWTRGDIRFNNVPVEQGTAGSKYIVTGWKCLSTGTPGTWVEMRTLTGN